MVVTGATALVFTVVPPSANPSSKLNADLYQRLTHGGLDADIIELLPTTTTITTTTTTTTEEHNNPPHEQNTSRRHRHRRHHHDCATTGTTVGRIRFRPNTAHRTTTAPPYTAWSSILSTVKSIRFIVTEFDNVTTTDDEVSLAEKFHASLMQPTTTPYDDNYNEHGGGGGGGGENNTHDNDEKNGPRHQANAARSSSSCKDTIYEIYHAFGNQDLSNRHDLPQFTEGAIHFVLSCRRWKCCVVPNNNKEKGLSMTTLNHEFRRVVAQHYGWTPHRKRLVELPPRPGSGGRTTTTESRPDLEFQVVLYEDKCFVELILLVPANKAAMQELPRPGCKRVEAWMMVQTANIAAFAATNSVDDSSSSSCHDPAPEVVVLDPFCGKATFLVEAATTIDPHKNTHITYIGVDSSATQLEHARVNLHDTGTNHSIQLHQGEARQLDFLRNHSVDAIMTCPPFGRQFGHDIADRTSFYRDCLVEWARVLKPGRSLVVLIDTENAPRVLEAIHATKVLQLDVHREPFRLGRLQATVLVASRKTGSPVVVAAPIAPLASSSSTTTTRTATNNNFAAAAVGMVAVGTALPWEGDVPVTRATWTRMRAAAMPSLVPYTHHHHPPPPLHDALLEELCSVPNGL